MPIPQPETQASGQAAGLASGQAAGLATLVAPAEADQSPGPRQSHGRPWQAAPPVPPVLAPTAQGRAGRHSRRPADAIPVRRRLAYAVLLAGGLFLATRFAIFWFNPARMPRDFGPRLGPGTWPCSPR